MEKLYGVITLVGGVPRWPRPRPLSPTDSSPVCAQPCSLSEKKKSRVGSVVMPYIMSSTLRRMSTVSTVSSSSSGLSSGSASSDGPAHPESVESEQMRSLLG